MVAISSPAEQRFLLQNISWQLFENLLAELGEQRSIRLAYYKGNLEFMAPLWEHENPNRKIEAMVIALVDELKLNIEMGGSVTLKRLERAAGKEPDSCYYIQNEARVRGKTKIDLTQDPPPDLAVEIDITSSSLNQLALYADLGVPEVWRYDGQRLQIYQLETGQYVERDRSATFPLLPASKVDEFLEQCQTIGVTASIRQFRAWVRTQPSHPETGQS